MKKNLPDYDIAVVGGGAGGVYTAWRMLLEGSNHSPRLKKWKEERGGKLKIAIFEESNRIGGRVLSAKAPGLPDVVCEIGGMRYVSNQPLVKTLVEKKLKLKSAQQEVHESGNILSLRGKKMIQSDLSNPYALPYKFSQAEIIWLNKDVTPKNTADNFLGYAVELIFPDIKEHAKKGTIREYLNDFPPIDGKPVHQHGFWNLVAPYLSHEAYEVAVTAVGYDCLGFNTNAVDAICEYFDSFTPHIEYFLLEKGYDSMLWEMQKQFEEAGGEVLKGKSLRSFDKAILADGTNGVELNFKKQKASITARSVVLAMPRRSLELLSQRGPVLDPDTKTGSRVRHLMDSVQPIDLYKMFIAYDTPWWEKVGVAEGRSLTDIPIRQCFYWGKEPTNGNAILMIYNDALSSDFWGGLRRKRLGSHETTTEYTGENFKGSMPYLKPLRESDEWDQRLHQNWKLSKAPKAMVDEMHRQLMIMHDVNKAPEPIDAAFMDWGDDPYGGAVHFWNVGWDSSKVVHEMIQPVKGIECYICGEAYSQKQTWVEGALQTAELVLRKFDIPNPEWLHCH